MDGLTGIIVGAIFGSLFLMTCIISAVKAVRDRKRIKAKIAQRGREKQANRTLPEAGIEDRETGSCHLANDITVRTDECNGYFTPGIKSTHSKTKSEDDKCSYSSCNAVDDNVHQGIDNLTFERSFVEIPLADESTEEDSKHIKHKSKTNPALQSACKNTSVSFCDVVQTKPHTGGDYNYSIEKRGEATMYSVSESNRDKMKICTSSDDKDTQIEMKHLSPDCLAVIKHLRRNSYEVAISDHSWLSSDQPPTFSSVLANSRKRYSNHT